MTSVATVFSPNVTIETLAEYIAMCDANLKLTIKNIRIETRTEQQNFMFLIIDVAKVDYEVTVCQQCLNLVTPIVPQLEWIVLQSSVEGTVLQRI